MTEPVAVIRPVFVTWIALVAQLPFQLFLTVWAGGFFGGLLGGGPEHFIPIGAFAFIAIPFCCWSGKKLNYANTTYTVYDDRLELSEGFLTTQRKTIRFKDVREVMVREGVMQRAEKLGSVHLATQASGSGRGSPMGFLGFHSVSNSGLTLLDIENSEQVYQNLKDMVKAHS